MRIEINKKEFENISLRISGDSGDGIQVIGNILSQVIAQKGNNISTIPDYPSEIRAPSGTIEGVSSFSISFGNKKIIPPSNKVDLLVIFNPASLKANLSFLKKNTAIIINSSSFTEDNLRKANYSFNPLEDGSLNDYQIISVDIYGILQEVLSGIEANNQIKLKSKNFFILGYLLSTFGYDIDYSSERIEEKFSKDTKLKEINSKALNEGKNHFNRNNQNIFEIYSSSLQKKGKYRMLNGNEAVAYGLMIGSKILEKKLYYGSYPITPASDILHTLLKYRSEDIIVFQAEDEIAATGGAIGASFAGSIGVTGTSGPGLSLKTEMLNLAVMTELPLIVIDVQRGGPSTGLPTKTEQGDLFQSMFGRNGDSPLVVMAVSNIEDCFNLSIEAIRIATKYMTPVIILSDSYLANNKESFRIPELSELPKFELENISADKNIKAHTRNPENLARQWIYPGMKGMEYRIGGLEKDYETGKVSYNGENHEKMTLIRKEKNAGIAREVPKTEINGNSSGDLLVIGWGSTYNSITIAVNKAISEGLKVASIHLKFINPLPSDLAEIISKFDKILLPEENAGQLKYILESELKTEIIPLNKIQGQTLYPEEILEKIREIIK